MNPGAAQGIGDGPTDIHSAPRLVDHNHCGRFDPISLRVSRVIPLHGNTINSFEPRRFWRGKAD